MRGTPSVFLLIASASQASLGCNGPLIATVGRISQSADSAPPTGMGLHREGGVGASSDAGDGGVPTTDAGARNRDTVQIEPGGRDEFCMRHGPAVRIVSAASAASSPAVCNAGVGRRLFSYGLCSCGDALINSGFSTDSFDSQQHAYGTGPSALGGAVGINGALGTQGDFFTLGGTVIVAGRGPLTIANAGSFSGSLKTNAALAFNTSLAISVQGDLWADADINASEGTTVKGDVYQTPGHALAASVQVTGSVHTSEFVVAAPCPCGADAVLDVAAIVAEAQHENDNDPLGISADAFAASKHDAGVSAQLTCGRVWLDDAVIPADSFSTVAQRLALFVHGDLTVGANFATNFGPTGELDVFVSGDLKLDGPIGNTDHPTALRFYVGGSQPIAFGGSLVTFAAQLYAPNAAVLLEPSPMNFFGSIFAARFEAQGTFESLHYDRAVLELGEACDPVTPTPCEQCVQCPAGLTCRDGRCGACQSTADCCEPMVCSEGTCQPQLALTH